jgi:hypothetical protein
MLISHYDDDGYSNSNGIVLCCISFPDNMKLLNHDPYIWIGDTASTVHTMGHDGGMIESK